MKKIVNTVFVCAIVFPLFLCGCASPPALYTLPVSANVNLYYIPMTDWQPAKGPSLNTTLDFSYRSEEGSPVRCNVSVFSENAVPGEVSAASLEGEKAAAPLMGIEELLRRPEKKELRVTTRIDIEDFIKVLKSEEIVFVCRVDGEDRRCEAPKAFYQYARQFLLSLDR